jgi:small GTP-binding protein
MVNHPHTWPLGETCALAAISKKICLLGDFAVGKTSLVRRFVYSLFDDKYISTIGVKVSRKTVVIPRDDDVVELTMMLWDLAGSEEFSQARASYLRGAAGAALVCDLTRPDTLASLQVYADDLLGLNPHARLVLAANKSDLAAQQRLTPEQIEDVAAVLSAPYCLTSAKTGDEVEPLFRLLGKLLVT